MSSGLAVKPVKLEPVPQPERTGQSLFDGNFQLIRNLKVKLSVLVGRAEVPVGELFALRDGSILTLDTLVDEPVVLVLDGKVIAAGELVVVEDNFGIRITAIGQQP